MIDLHRHDEFSLYDGFSKPIHLAALAKEMGHSALSTSNHGTTAGLAETYFACKEVGIKSILGVEAYFQPKFDKEKKDRFHLCLFVKNLQGYKNLNRIMTIANMEKMYYKPVVDFELLEKYSEGLICTSACIGGVISKAFAAGNDDMANKLIRKFKSIYGEDFYIEIMPYELTEKGLQEKVNIKLIEAARENKIKCILTSDSHYGRKADYDSYLKMHEMGGHEVGDTYKERYMPTEEEMMGRFVDMHGNDFEAPRKLARRMIDNLEEINSKIDEAILEQLPLRLPTLTGDSLQSFRQEIVKGLKKLGKYNAKYLDRCKEEAKVIEHLGFVDYFLIVQDYVKETHRRDIAIGPGRGSVCNCLIAYAMGITKIDSIYFNLDFDRFMRMDKKKVPDVDLDFETERRHEIIEYLVQRYPGHAAQVVSYGLYKVDNLLNDLFKVCGVESAETKAQIKKYVKSKLVEDEFDWDAIKVTAEYKMWNKQCDNILKHFSKMYKKIKYYGTHAAGVAITGDDLVDYVALEMKGGKVVTAYDLGNLELIKVVKFDILGLRTMSTLKELEDMTGEKFDYSWCEDKNLLEEFGKGNTDGIFQFESAGSQGILREIGADCMEDILAGSALNRPGPLSIGMPAQYAHNKQHIENIKNNKWYRYAKETYGSIVYQEQIVRVCREIGKFEWSEVDRILKVLKGRGRAIKFRDKEIEALREIFLKGAMSQGYSKAEATDIFSILLIYSFNKGHAAGYGVVSLQQMYYKVYYPELFWYVTLKYAKEEDRFRFETQTVKDGNLILLPHVNYGAYYKIVKLEGEGVLAQGLTNIKNVGEKAALAIESERRANGRFKDLDDFLDRVPKRVINMRVIKALQEQGALEFNESIYFSRVKKHNSSLYAKGLNS
jgi:DNA polymerase-3 subunit alpha